MTAISEPTRTLHRSSGRAVSVAEHLAEKPDRYYSFDVVRGFAALSVVVWHWQDFFFSAATKGPVLPSRAVQPFYAILEPLYENGGNAVFLFFCLSGFIFFCLYEKAIEERRLSISQFALLRISRLYPLHIATLLLVAVLQLVYCSQKGTYFVYHVNDSAHFIQQMFFASHWLPAPYSFNGPTWSVSIEVLMYIIFFGLCRSGATRLPILMLLCLVGMMLTDSRGFWPIGEGFIGFFLGGICFRIYTFLQKADHALRRYLIYTVVGIGTIFAAIQTSGHTLSCLTAIAQYFSTFSHIAIAPLDVQQYLGRWWVRIIAFPTILLLCALSENRTRKLFKKLAWIGDITYSSYLIHFPLQLIFVLIAMYCGFELNPCSPAFFILYMGVLIVSSLLIFHFLSVHYSAGFVNLGG